MAQTATAESKPIGILFALVGLHLHVDRGFTGAQVQQVHRRLASRKRQWPTIDLPLTRGNMTPADVIAVPAGADRDAAIDRWCSAVWEAFSTHRPTIVQLLAETKDDAGR